MRIILFAMTLLGSGGRDVPVAMRERGASAAAEGAKKSAGTEPQVRGAMKVAIAVWPGWRKRRNL